MTMLESKLKPWVEIAALAIGTLVGVVSLYQQLKPSSVLTAEILTTKAPLPPEFEANLRGLPERLHKALVEPPQKGSTVAPETVAVAAQAKTLAEAAVKDLDWPLHFSEDFFVCSVQNNGDTPLEGVQLAFTHFPAVQLKIDGPDGVRKTIKSSGIIEIGDLRPAALARVYAWGLGVSLFSLGNVQVSHKGGKGEVREVRAVPSLVASGGGVWFSYRTAFYLLFSASLIILAFLAIRRSLALRRSQQKTGPAS